MSYDIKEQRFAKSLSSLCLIIQLQENALKDNRLVTQVRKPRGTKVHSLKW